MQAEVTQDFDYVKGLVSKPGITRLCSGGLPVGDIDSIIRDHNLFVQITKDGRRMGFISFHKATDTIAEIHVVLRTMGEDTVKAIHLALQKAREAGFKLIYAIFPAHRVALERLTHICGFEHVSMYNHEGFIFSVNKLAI